MRCALFFIGHSNPSRKNEKKEGSYRRRETNGNGLAAIFPSLLTSLFFPLAISRVSSVARGGGRGPSWNR